MRNLGWSSSKFNPLLLTTTATNDSGSFLGLVYGLQIQTPYNNGQGFRSREREMAMGQGGAKGWGLRPHPYGFVLPHSHPAPHDGKNFLTLSPPLRALQSPPHPVKLYFLLIYPTTSTLFLMKPISLIKIYLNYN